jgi:hypothetical protein
MACPKIAFSGLKWGFGGLKSNVQGAKKEMTPHSPMHGFPTTPARNLGQAPESPQSGPIAYLFIAMYIYTCAALFDQVRALCFLRDHRNEHLP